MCGIVCTIQDITSSLYELKPPFLWHHAHYIWHHGHCICVTTSIVLMISHQLYLWDLIRYISSHHILCLQHHIHYICSITATGSVSSQPHCRWYHTLYMYDITPTMSDIASIVSVSSQPLYWWSQTNCMYDIIPTLYMTSYVLYRTSHLLFLNSHHCIYAIISTAFLTSQTMYTTSHTWQHNRYICHLNQYIWHYIHCICVMKLSV